MQRPCAQREGCCTTACSGHGSSQGPNSSLPCQKLAGQHVDLLVAGPPDCIAGRSGPAVGCLPACGQRQAQPEKGSVCGSSSCFGRSSHRVESRSTISRQPQSGTAKSHRSLRKPKREGSWRERWRISISSGSNSRGASRPYRGPKRCRLHTGPAPIHRAIQRGPGPQSTHRSKHAQQ